MKLHDLEMELREMDSSQNYFSASFKFLLDYVSIKKQDESIYGLNTTSDFIELAVERIKGPEVLFQPKIGGVDQSGLSETIHQVLKRYNEDIQQTLLQNIFLTVFILIFFPI